MRKYSIKDWAEDDKPREKLMNKGVGALSDSELLAILIQTGSAGQSAVDVAKKLLQSVNNDLRRLADLSVKEMVKSNIKGFGEVKAISIAAALELGIRRTSTISKREHITRSTDMADYLRSILGFKKREAFVVVFLNRRNKIVHIEPVSQGGLTSTVADPRVILKKALEHNATALILCHNHPGGSLRPSQGDELLTQKIKQAASLFDIHIMDHIIVSDEGHFSFADEGML